jgi:hypothetical protein
MSSPSENCPDCGGTGFVLKVDEEWRCPCTQDTEPHDPDK